MGKLCLALGVCGLRVLGFVTDPWLSRDAIHAVRGEPARIERPWGVPAALRVDGLTVVTWNVERGTAYEAILSVLRHLDADILLLQEVDRGCRRTAYRDIARDLAHALEMNWVAAGEFQEIGEARGEELAITGQAILSRFPLENPDVLRFRAQDRWRWSVNPVQPRRGGRIALTARSADLVLYNTHIESGGNNGLKRRQVAEILAHQARSTDAATPVLIAGDFNNAPLVRWQSLSSLVAARFEDALGEAGNRGPTSLGQDHPIDWIFVRNVEPLTGRVVDAPAASDHSPVLAMLDVATAVVATR
jgi:endonuclease/exonuclease/phosphatase family metal-dependent hydrolase